MKKSLLLIVALLASLSAWAEVEINETNFPDANFRNWLLEQSYGQDSVLYEWEILSVRTIHCDNRGILNLTGIEHFLVLEELYCHSNNLTTLDLSQNTYLRQLDCHNNNLTSLDLSHNNYLERVSLYYNHIKLPEMGDLIANLPDHSDEVDDETGHGWREFLVIYEFEEDILDWNIITREQVEVARAKGWDACDDGEHYFEGMNLAFADEAVPDPNFRNWFVENGFIEDGYVKVDLLPGYIRVQVPNMEIADLTGIEYFTGLKYLQCYNNLLTSLDLSHNTELKTLSCYNNLLTSLDLSNHSELVGIGCFNNRLTTLDVSGCNALVSIFCYDNRIKGENMDSLIASLPIVENGALRVINLNSSTEQNVITPTQVATANSKGWQVLDSDGNPYDGSIPGDVNGDGSVTSADVTCIYNYLLNGDQSLIDTCDVDGDGSITSADITFIYNILLGSKK